MGEPASSSASRSAAKIARLPNFRSAELRAPKRVGDAPFFRTRNFRRVATPTPRNSTGPPAARSWREGDRSGDDARVSALPPEPLRQPTAFARWPGPAALVGSSRIDPHARTVVAGQIEIPFDDVTAIIVGAPVAGTLLAPWAVQVVVRDASAPSLDEQRAEIESNEELSDDERARALFALHEDGPASAGDAVTFAGRVAEPRAWHIGESLATTLQVPLLTGDFAARDRRDPDELTVPFAERLKRGPTPPPQPPIPGSDNAPDVDIECGERPHQLRLRWKWTKHALAPLLLFLAMALGMIVMPGVWGGIDTYFAILAAMTVAIFAPILLAMAAFLSPRTLEVSEDTLTIVRRWPWPRTRTIAVSDLLGIRVWSGGKQQIRFRTRERVLGSRVPLGTGKWVEAKVARWLWERVAGETTTSRPPN